MKLVYVTTLYTDYINGVYGKSPDLSLQNYEYQKTILDYDSFGWADFWSNSLKLLGYDVLDIRLNVSYLQFQWAKENNVELNGVDLESSQSPSFPSGHAGQAVITALVLSELYPELEEKLKDLAQEISYSRNMAKVHYPSDTKVGKEVARDMFEYLKESGELDKLFKKYGVKKNTKK